MELMNKDRLFSSSAFSDDHRLSRHQADDRLYVIDNQNLQPYKTIDGKLKQLGYTVNQISLRYHYHTRAKLITYNVYDYGWSVVICYRCLLSIHS